MAKTDKEIQFCVYKNEHGKPPVIRGSGALTYNILVKNNLKSANRDMHNSKVIVKHKIDPKNRGLFQVLDVDY